MCPEQFETEQFETIPGMFWEQSECAENSLSVCCKKDDWSDERPWTSDRVLRAIHAEQSPINWGLFKPSQKEVKAVKWGSSSTK